MARNDRVEVLLAVRALDRRGEEAAEGRDQRGEDGKDEFVEVDRAGGEPLDVEDVGQSRGEGVEVGLVVVRERAAGVVEGTVEMRDLDGVNDDLTNDDGADAAADEALPALVGGQGRERLGEEPGSEGEEREALLAEKHAAEVSHGVIGDDGGGGEHEPDETVHHHRHDGADLEHHDHDGQHRPRDLAYAIRRGRDRYRSGTSNNPS